MKPKVAVLLAGVVIACTSAPPRRVIRTGSSSPKTSNGWQRPPRSHGEQTPQCFMATQQRKGCSRFGSRRQKVTASLRIRIPSPRSLL